MRSNRSAPQARGRRGLAIVVLAMLGCSGGGGTDGVKDATPPSILSVNPSDGAVAVPVSTSVRVVFNEGMDPSTIVQANFFLEGQGGVAGTVAYDPATHAATFTPSAPLSSNSTYTVFVTRGVKDLAGNAMPTDYRGSFATPDTLPPAVAATSPAPDAKVLAFDAPIVIDFTELMDPATVNGATLVVSTGATTVPGTITSSGGAASHFVFTPSAAFSPGTTYTVTITAGVKDLAGNAMAASYAWTFATATVPTVVSTTPLDAASNVPVEAAIRVAFSEPMNCASIDASSFALGGPLGTVTGTILCSGTGAELQPAAPLAHGTAFTATVTSAAVSAVGKHLPASTVWTFQTAPDPLDLTFGTAGKVINSFLPGTARGVALQADGKVVIAGYTSYIHFNFTLARYNADGTPDQGIGTNVGGLVTTSIGSSDAMANAVAIQPDGKILLAGSAFVGGSKDFALVRYNPDATLDSTFGSGGIVTTDFGGKPDEAFAVALQADGKIVLAGSAMVGSNLDFALARYDVNGGLDPTFGSGGKVTTALSVGADAAYGLGIQADGRIVAAGYVVNALNGYAFALARYNADGSVDSTFGVGGTVTTVLGGPYGAYDAPMQPGLAMQADGRIVVAGDIALGLHRFATLRYNTDGSLDTTFGGGGVATEGVRGGDSRAYAVVVRPDAKIVVAGAGASSFALVRYSANGALDPSLGGTGVVTTDFGGPSGARCLALQADGKVVAAGSVFSDIAVARYLP